MNSEELEKLISRYNDPDLTDEERTQLDQVLEDDPVLRGILEQYQRLDGALGQLPDGLEKVDFARFSRQVREAVAGVEASWLSTLSLRRFLMPIAAAAAIIIAALPIFLLPDRRPPQPVGEFVAVVKLAQPQTMFAQTMIKNIGDIIPPEPALAEGILSTEESDVGVVWSSPAQPDRSEQRRTTQIFGIFDIFMDGSP
ncbi:MAG: hypothetical protein AMJ79_02720 [Phycisphaerae bacterium SM23_30]|nr:MAG: hypothetical protein AMJ79_02720 [Phycisphaerae bacterium SM23_30]